jgi:dihydrofolate reductase
MKLTTTTHVSVDGVMQRLGAPDEDRRGGFERGGWALPLFDDEAATFLDEVYQRADAFLFGRRTYEIFAGSWGTGSWGANQGNNPISVALNTRPKYVAVDNHLVDEITLLTYPVVVGQGTRLFPATGPDTAFELVDSQSTPKGVSIQVYRPTGRPQYATATAT